MGKSAGRVLRKVILFLFGYSSLYIVRTALSVCSDTFCTSGILSVVQYGLTGSLFFIFYALGRVVNGYIGDYIQPKVLISLGICISGICSIVIGLFPSSGVILVAWTVNAYAQSMVWSPMLVCIVNEKSPLEKFYISMTGSSVAFGTVVGTIIISKILAKSGIGLSFIVPGIISIICGLLVVPVCNGDVNLAKDPGKKNNPVKLLCNPQLKTLWVPLAINGMLKDGIPLWMFSYVIHNFGLDISQISLFIVFIPLLGGISRLLYEPCRRAFDSEITLALVTYCLSLIFAAFLYTGRLSFGMAVLSLAMIYSFASISNMSFVGIFPLRFAESRCTSLASGLVDLLIYAGAGISSIVFGYVVDGPGYESMFGIWFVCILVSIPFLFHFVKNFENRKE